MWLVSLFVMVQGKLRLGLNGVLMRSSRREGLSEAGGGTRGWVGALWWTGTPAFVGGQQSGTCKERGLGQRPGNIAGAARRDWAFGGRGFVGGRGLALQRRSLWRTDGSGGARPGAPWQDSWAGVARAGVARLLWAGCAGGVA